MSIRRQYFGSPTEQRREPPPIQRGFDSPDEQPKRKLYNPEALPSEHALDTPKAKDKNTRRKKEVVMDGVKLVVIYPRPTDVERFEKVYTEEHIPMANQLRNRLMQRSHIPERLAAPSD
jgi:hypothetical protein